MEEESKQAAATNHNRCACFNILKAYLAWRSECGTEFKPAEYLSDGRPISSLLSEEFILSTPNSMHLGQLPQLRAPLPRGESGQLFMGIEGALFDRACTQAFSARLGCGSSLAPQNQSANQMLWEWFFSEDLFWFRGEAGNPSQNCTMKSPERCQAEETTLPSSTPSTEPHQESELEALICRYKCSSIGAVHKGAREEIVQRGALEARFKLDRYGHIKLDRLDLIFDTLGFLVNIKRALAPPYIPPTVAGTIVSDRQADLSRPRFSHGTEDLYPSGLTAPPGLPLQDTDKTFASLGYRAIPGTTEDTIVRARIEWWRALAQLQPNLYYQQHQPRSHHHHQPQPQY